MPDPDDLRFVQAADGVRIALHRLGGSGDSLLVSHATGFHGRAYQPLATSLAPDFRTAAIDERGHGQSGLPADLVFDWNGFGLDVLAAADDLEGGRLLGLGHSAGATALIVAELARPGTFGAIYCYEPIIFPFEEPLGPTPDGPLSAAALRRREVFDSRQAAFDNYRSKPPLNALDVESLSAYVEFGFEDLPDGSVRLLCRRDNEAAIYAAATTLDVYRRLGEVSCPVVLAGGAATDAIRPDHLELLAERLPKSSVEVFEGMGHFGPLQDHRRVAGSVSESLRH
jgi:pimeloyl-ACP methyl ester carboxylesterase